MVTREMLIKEIEKIPDDELVFNLIWDILKKQEMGIKVHRVFKGRPVVKVEELSKINCPYPKEPDWENEN